MSSARRGRSAAAAQVQQQPHAAASRLWQHLGLAAVVLAVAVIIGPSFWMATPPREGDTPSEVGSSNQTTLPSLLHGWMGYHPLYSLLSSKAPYARRLLPHSARNKKKDTSTSQFSFLQQDGSAETSSSYLQHPQPVCEAVHIVAVMRHGTRHLSSMKPRKALAKVIRKHSSLSSSSSARVQSWLAAEEGFAAKDEGLLSSLGYHELHGQGWRLAMQFPDLFKRLWRPSSRPDAADAAVVATETTWKQRTAQSRDAYLSGIARAIDELRKAAAATQTTTTTTTTATMPASTPASASSAETRATVESTEASGASVNNAATPTATVSSLHASYRDGPPPHPLSQHTHPLPPLAPSPSPSSLAQHPSTVKDWLSQASALAALVREEKAHKMPAGSVLYSTPSGTNTGGFCLSKAEHEARASKEARKALERQEEGGDESDDEEHHSSPPPASSSFEEALRKQHPEFASPRFSSDHCSWDMARLRFFQQCRSYAVYKAARPWRAVLDTVAVAAFAKGSRGDQLVRHALGDDIVDGVIGKTVKKAKKQAKKLRKTLLRAVASDNMHAEDVKKTWTPRQRKLLDMAEDEIVKIAQAKAVAKLLKNMWKLCAVQATVTGVTDQWCSAFTGEAVDVLQLLERLGDLQSFFKKGPYNKITYASACPLLNAMLEGADFAAQIHATAHSTYSLSHVSSADSMTDSMTAPSAEGAGEPNSKEVVSDPEALDLPPLVPPVRLYFAHAETLAPLLALIGVGTGENVSSSTSSSTRSSGGGGDSAVSKRLEDMSVAELVKRFPTLPLSGLVDDDGKELPEAAILAALRKTAAVSAATSSPDGDAMLYSIQRNGKQQQEQQGEQSSSSSSLDGGSTQGVATDVMWKSGWLTPMGGNVQIVTYACTQPSLETGATLTSTSSSLSRPAKSYVMQLVHNENPIEWPISACNDKTKPSTSPSSPSSSVGASPFNLITSGVRSSDGEELRHLCPVGTVREAYAEHLQRLGMGKCDEKDWRKACDAADA